MRFSAADDIPLSTACGPETAYVAIHTFQGVNHRPYFDRVEAELRALRARPHWGKLHSLTADELRGLYPQFDEFVKVRNAVDPEGRFANSYLDRVLGPPSTID